MAILPENRTVLTENGAGVAVRLLGTVVAMTVSSNTSELGDEATVSVGSPGGITDPPGDSEFPGTAI